MVRTSNDKDNKAVLFEECYKLYFLKVVYYANSYLNDIEAARDIGCEVFLTVWEKRQHINFSIDMLPFLLVLARNRCLNRLKKIQTENRYKQEILEYQKREINYISLSESALVKLYSSEIKEMIEEAVEQMPEKVRRTFHMSRFKRMKYSEIAIQENVSVKAVEKRIMLALKILRVKLKDYLPK